MLQNDKRRLPVIIGLMLLAFALYRFDSLIDLLRALMSILSPFLIGLFMALLINLPMRFLDRALVFADKNPRLKSVKRAITLTLSLLFVLAVIAVLLVVIIPEVVTAVERLIQVIPSLLKELETWLSERNANIRSSLGLVETSENEVRNIFLSAYQFLIGGLSYSSGVVVSAAQYLVNLIVALVFAIYLLFSKERITDQLSRFLRAALPYKANVASAKIIRMLITSYSNFLGGQCLQAFISSTSTVVILLLFGFPYAVLIGLITFVAAFIPVFGPYISGLLGMLLVLTADPGQTLWFLLIFFFVQQVTGSVIYPRIMSNAIDIPSIWILIAVTLGGGILGIPGMLIFIPLMAVAYHLVAEFVKNRETEREIKAGAGT
jgi:predicted PurR-regulated permease PerM